MFGLIAKPVTCQCWTQDKRIPVRSLMQTAVLRLLHHAGMSKCLILRPKSQRDFPLASGEEIEANSYRSMLVSNENINTALAFHKGQVSSVLGICAQSSIRLKTLIRY